MRPLLLLFRRDIHRLEYDPATQYRFNLVATWFWVLCMLGVPFISGFRSNILSLLIMEASLWANAATHFGGMSSALAAKQTNPVATQNKSLAAPQTADVQIIETEMKTQPSPSSDAQAVDF